MIYFILSIIKCVGTSAYCSLHRTERYIVSHSGRGHILICFNIMQVITRRKLVTNDLENEEHSHVIVSFVKFRKITDIFMKVHKYVEIAWV